MTATTERAVLGYFWGDDGYGLERAADALADRLGEASGIPPERTRTSGESTSAGRIAERVAMAPLFGGGTLLTIVDPAPLVRSRGERDAIVAALATVAPGNGLVFLEPVDGSGRRPASLDALRDAVSAFGGETRELKAPRERQMAAWIEARALERTIRLGPGAAQELAERVGAFVREGDVDRRRMGQLAVTELEKLAIHSADRPVERADVQALVAEAVPASTWAFLDAMAARNSRQAAVLLDQLLETTPEPLILAQIHTRLRQLIEVADRLDAGMSLPVVARELGFKEFRARKLAEQARRWTVDQLVDALDGLLGLDALVKGADPASDRQRRLAFQLWVRDRVGGR